MATGTKAKAMAAKAMAATEAELKVGTRAKAKAQGCMSLVSSTFGAAASKDRDNGTTAMAEIGAESDH